MAAGRDRQAVDGSGDGAPRSGGRTVRVHMLMLAALAFTPLILLYAAILWEQARHEQHEAEDSVTTTSRALANDFAATMAQSKRMLEVIAARPDIVALSPVRCNLLLAELLTLHQVFPTIAIVDPSGATVCQGGAGIPPEGGITATWLAEMLSSGATVISGPFPFSDPHWGVVVATPIRAPDGAARGALALVVNLQQFQEYFVRLELKPNAIATLLSNEGIVLARSRDASQWVGKDITATPAGRHVLGQDSGVATVAGLDGVQRITGYRTVPGTNWRIAVGVPASHVTSRVQAIVLVGGLAGATVLLLVAVAAVLLSRRITRPLRALSAASLAVAAGDTGVRAAAHGPTEVADVARAFNLMLETRARITNQLARSEALYRTIADHFPDGALVLFDTELRCLAAGGRALTEIGLTPAQMVGRRLDELVPPEIMAVAEPWWGAALAGQSLVREALWRGRWYEINVHPVGTDHGAVWAGLAVAMDRTARREAEQAREKLRQQESAAAAAAEAERLRTEIVNTISHELRTPLGAIKGYTSTLLAFGTAISPDERVEFLHEIEAAADQLSGLVASLVSVAAVEHEPAPARRVLIAVADVVPPAVEQAAAAFPGRDIAVTLPARPRPFLGDAARLTHALGVLLVNALTYSAATEPVQVRVESTADGGTAIRVTDRGPGIPPEEHGRIFERFHRGADDLRSGRRGAGVGLAICRRIVEEEGGHVELESAPGHGSTFSIVLPPAKASTTAPAPPDVAGIAGD